MEKLRQFLYPLNIKQFILSNALMGIVIVAIFMRGAFESYQKFLLGSLWAFIICITQWTGPVVINYLLDLRIKWIEKPILRSIAGIITMVSYSVLAFITVQFVMLYILYRTSPFDAWQSVSHSIIVALLISLMMSLTFTAIGFFKAWKRELTNAAKLKEEMMAYKYESLRNQLNPHFLFNSFNVLSDLVYADQSMAVKFIQQMSDLFRYVLDSRDKELVPLADELEFLRSFAYLLKTRFEEKLDIDIELQASPGEFIVPMTLQLLVENAVKHNEASEAFPLRISIRKNEDYLEVENAMQIKHVGEDSKNTGLKNIEQQFSFFTDKLIEINQSNGKFLVRVPILTAVEK
jgi:two-component system, LytTR family, sensor kinase